MWQEVRVAGNPLVELRHQLHGGEGHLQVHIFRLVEYPLKDGRHHLVFFPVVKAGWGLMGDAGLLAIVLLVFCFVFVIFIH